MLDFPPSTEMSDEHLLVATQTLELGVLLFVAVMVGMFAFEYSLDKPRFSFHVDR